MILFTSDMNNTDKIAFRIARNDLYAAIFCLLFGAVYELFSHDVYSYYMIYAGCIPLLFGTLPWLLAGLSDKKKKHHAAACQVWHAGLATLTVGCLFKGMLEIYGTTSRFTNVYWIVGGLLLVCALVLKIVKRPAKEK